MHFPDLIEAVESTPMVVVFAVLIGLCFGSFANVVASRVPEGRSVVTPGSRCPNCCRSLGWWENIPLFSYVMLGGRCRSCVWKIPFRYFLTELLAGALFGAVAWKFGLTWRLPLLLTFTFTLLAITVTDLEHKRIPATIVWWSLAICVPLMVVAALSEGRPGAMGVAAAGAVAFSGALRIIHELNPKWMGFGDVRLALLLGLVLGFLGAKVLATGVMLSFIYGTVIGLLLIVGGKGEFGKAVPFGPYLALGAVTAMMLGDSAWAAYTRLLGGI